MADPEKALPWREWKSQKIGGRSRLSWLRQAVDERRLSMLFGAGLTAGLLKSARGNTRGTGLPIEGWNLLLDALKAESGILPDGAIGSSVELETAFSLRRVLINSGQWPDPLENVVVGAVNEAWPSLCDGGFRSSPWGAVIHALRRAASENRAPLAFTTNYDDLLARLLGWQVVYFPDTSGQASADGPLVPAERRAEIVAPRGAEGRSADPAAAIRQLQRLEDFVALHKSGWISPDQHFVIHLHGWLGEPRTMVFDPGNYERLQSEVFKQFEARFSDPDDPVLVVGMGAGLFDPHFARYLCPEGETEAQRKRLPSPSNLWLLLEDSVAGIRESAKSLSIGLGRLEIVTFESYQDLPGILSEILESP
jgi:hypothetical protein